MIAHNSNWVFFMHLCRKLEIVAIYTLYPESFWAENLAIRKFSLFLTVTEGRYKISGETVQEEKFPKKNKSVFAICCYRCSAKISTQQNTSTAFPAQMCKIWEMRKSVEIGQRGPLEPDIRVLILILGIKFLLPPIFFSLNVTRRSTLARHQCSTNSLSLKSFLVFFLLFFFKCHQFARSTAWEIPRFHVLMI